VLEPPLILVADLDPARATRIAGELEAVARVLAVDPHGSDDLTRLVGEHEPALVVLGQGDAGLADCRRIHALRTERPVHVMLVGERADAAGRGAAFDAGADDFLAWPCEPAELLARATLHVRHRHAVANVARLESEDSPAAECLATLIEEQARGIIVARTMTAHALATLAERRDAETGEHLERMRDYAVAIAEELGREGAYAGLIDGTFIEQLHHAAPLHDIGKVAIPDAILRRPGHLSPEQFEIMKTHAEAGARVLEAILGLEVDGGVTDEVSFMPMAVAIARSHHERWDGRGYPDGLAAEAIPLSARVTAVADVLDALASARVYKRAMPLHEAREVLLESAGSHFDPEIVAAADRAWPTLVAIHDRFEARRPSADVEAEPIAASGRHAA
jgi:putative two-component system response regulator